MTQFLIHVILIGSPVLAIGAWIGSLVVPVVVKMVPIAVEAAFDVVNL